MKTKAIVLISVLILGVIIIAGSCATGKKMGKGSEELYGIWVNEKYAIRKYYTTLVWKPDGVYEMYVDASLKTLSARGKYIITDKWTDSEGNIWYKEHWKESRVYSGYSQSATYSGYSLYKISNSGKTLEFTSSIVDYPAEIDPNYSKIYYRK